MIEQLIAEATECDGQTPLNGAEIKVTLLAQGTE